MTIMKGRDRNAPCWCSSGKKYKNCHLNRASQPKSNRWAAVEANRKAFQQKRCFAADMGLGTCAGRIVKAHTVSRGSNLTAIAKNGHVLTYQADAKNLAATGGKLSLKSIGIRDASAFNGFCAYHDRVLFSCIENEAFTGRADQCLAIAYRTLSREVYGKDATSQLRGILSHVDAGLPIQNQIVLQKMLSMLDEGNAAARRELTETLAMLTTALAEKRTDEIQSLILEFDGRLPFMFAGAWSPLTDINGATLQIPYGDVKLEQVFFSSFAGTFRDFICVSWRKSAGRAGEIIAQQISALPGEVQATACFQLVVKHVENIFFNTDWFSSLSSAEKAAIEAFAMDGVDALGSVPSKRLELTISFGLPAAKTSSYV